MNRILLASATRKLQCYTVSTGSQAAWQWAWHLWAWLTWPNLAFLTAGCAQLSCAGHWTSAMSLQPSHWRNSATVWSSRGCVLRVPSYYYKSTSHVHWKHSQHHGDDYSVIWQLVCTFLIRTRCDTERGILFYKGTASQNHPQVVARLKVLCERMARPLQNKYTPHLSLIRLVCLCVHSLPFKNADVCLF